MTVNIAVAQGSLDSALASVDITASGFGEVKGALILAMEANAAGSVDNNAIFGMGFLDATGTQLSGGISCQNNKSTTDTRRGSSIDQVVTLPDVSGGTFADWSGEFITDGVRFTRVSATKKCYVQVLLIGGSGVLNTRAWGLGLLFQTSPYSLDTLGFQPDLVFGSSLGATSLTGDTADAVFAFGVAGMHLGATLTQWCTSFGSQDAQSSEVAAARHTEGKFLRTQDGVGSVITNMAMDSLDADGFTVSWSGGSTEFLWGLAIELQNPSGIYIGTGSIDTSATSWESAAAAVPPIFGLMTATDGVHTEGTTETTGVAGPHITLATPEHHYTAGVAMEDAASPTVDNTLRSYDAWEVMKQDSSTITADFSFTDNKMALGSIVGQPAYDTSVLYLMISDVLNVYKGADPVEKIYRGSDRVTGRYKGTTRIF